MELEPIPASVWWVRRDPVGQLQRFLRQFASAYQSVKRRRAVGDRQAIRDLAEAYLKTRHPVLYGTVRRYKTERSDWPLASFVHAKFNPLRGAEGAIKSRRLGPVVNVSVSPRAERTLNLEDLIGVLTHEAAHGAQHWRHGRALEPRDIQRAGWYYDWAPKGEWSYWANPFEHEAQRAGIAGRSDFRDFVEHLLGAMGPLGRPPDQALGEALKGLMEHRPPAGSGRRAVKELLKYVTE